MQSGLFLHDCALHEFSKPVAPVGLLTKLLARPTPFAHARPHNGLLPRQLVRTRAAATSSISTCQIPDVPHWYSSLESTGQQGHNLSSRAVDLGYARNLEDKYTWGQEIGKGGNASVRTIVQKDTGVEYACKCIPKVPPAEASDKKREGHLTSVQREIEVLTRLRGTLNVVKLEDVFEDDEQVYVIMELCKGGELCHRIGERHYSERTVASYMRAVLRTLAQCHSHHIIHRDIKPGNFMLLNDKDRSPLKAIDFGLAVPYQPDKLPLDNLGFEGTPWYMAPEVLSSRVTPASDIWSAGVMAAQLLTGRFPFDDWRNPYAPSLSAVWKSILTDPLNTNKSWWREVTPEAKEFVAWLLNRDPEKRPSAKDALNHPWLRGNSEERSAGRKLSSSVVQRIQRFAQSSVFKRSILQSMAAELLASQDACTVPGPAFDPSSAQGLKCSAVGDMVPGSIEDLCRKLNLEAGEADAEAVAKALRDLGYRLEASEAQRLMEQLDSGHGGNLQKSMFAASQLDWRSLQEKHLDMWLDTARNTFSSLDDDDDGVITLQQIADVVGRQVPPEELAIAMRQVLEEAGQEPGPGAVARGIDFDQFLHMLRPSSVDSLDLYDDRCSNGSSHGSSSVDRLNALLSRSVDRSLHGAGLSDASMHSMRSTDGSMHNGDASQHGRTRSLRKPATATAVAAAATTTAAGGTTAAVAPSGGGGVAGAAVPLAPMPVPKFRFEDRLPSVDELTADVGRDVPKKVVNKPGLQERRMHGSNLYRNAVLTR